MQITASPPLSEGFSLAAETEFGEQMPCGMAWVLRQHTDAPASWALHRAGFWCLYFIPNSQLTPNQMLNLQPGVAGPYAQLPISAWPRAGAPTPNYLGNIT